MEVSFDLRFFSSLQTFISCNKFSGLPLSKKEPFPFFPGKSPELSTCIRISEYDPPLEKTDGLLPVGPDFLLWIFSPSG